MTKACKYYAKYKAIYVPRCNHCICWGTYFVKNPGAFAAVRTMVQKWGEDEARAQVGDKYFKFFKMWEERLNDRDSTTNNIG
jgi:hypothetical protein